MEINFQVDPIDPGMLSHIFIKMSFADKTDYNINELIIPDTIDGNKILRLSLTLRYDIYELAAKGFFIKKLIVSEGIKELPIKCFYGVENINTVILPSTCIDIPPSCFELSSIKEVIASDNVCVIGASAFEQSNIERFSWPASCDTVPTRCFFACSNFEQIDGMEQIEDIGDSAFELTKLKYFSWPARCKIVSKRCFYECRNLEQIDGLERVTEIKVGAFQKTAIKKFLWPASVSATEPRVFLANCVNLEEIKFEGTGIKDVDLAYFFSLKSIKKIDLSGCAAVNLLGTDIPEYAEFKKKLLLPYYVTKLN